MCKICGYASISDNFYYDEWQFLCCPLCDSDQLIDTEDSCFINIPAMIATTACIVATKPESHTGAISSTIDARSVARLLLPQNGSIA